MGRTRGGGRRAGPRGRDPGSPSGVRDLALRLASRCHWRDAHRGCRRLVPPGCTRAGRRHRAHTPVDARRRRSSSIASRMAPDSCRCGRREASKGRGVGGRVGASGGTGRCGVSPGRPARRPASGSRCSTRRRAGRLAAAGTGVAGAATGWRRSRSRTRTGSRRSRSGRQGPPGSPRMARPGTRACVSGIPLDPLARGRS